MHSRWSRVTRIVQSRWAVLLAVCAGVILTLPSLRVGLANDDFIHRLMLTKPELLPGGMTYDLDLFRFFDGNIERTRQLIEEGFAPWYTWPHIRAAFWRPVTSFTHWLDYWLWPNVPALMHLQSIAWYAAVVLAAGVLYRRIVGVAAVTGLAAILYAVDHSHALPAGWLANRNAEVGAFFSVVTLILHDRWRRDRSRLAGALAPLALAAGLLSNEGSIATCAYLFAYAVFIDRPQATCAMQPLARRLLTLVPAAMVVIVWRAIWTAGGYGVNGVGLYVDPLREPLRFLGNAAWRAPVLLLGQWGLPPADLTTFLPMRATLIFAATAILVLLLLAKILWPLLRHEPTAKFWACGMLLAVVPACTTFPSNRMLFLVGLGAMGLLAIFLQRVFGGLQPGKWNRAAAYVLVLIHLILSPALLALLAAFPSGPDDAARQLYVRTPLDASVANQDLIVVNAPLAIPACLARVMRQLDGTPVPRGLRVLGPAIPAVEVFRSDERTLVLRPAWGFMMSPLDTIFRTQAHALAVGERVELRGMTAEVLSLTDDGRPAEVRFTFAASLEDARYRWVRYKDGEFVPFELPRIGDTVELEGRWPA